MIHSACYDEHGQEVVEEEEDEEEEEGEEENKDTEMSYSLGLNSLEATPER